MFETIATVPIKWSCFVYLCGKYVGLCGVLHPTVLLTGWFFR